MAEIVAAVLASHAPGITARPDIADPGQRERFVASWAVLRRRLEAARPDLLVAFVNDHIQNFFFNAMPAFCVGLADSYEAPSAGSAGFLRIPARRIPGARAWARQLLDAGLSAGFDFAYSEELEFWDEVSIPMHFLTPEAPVPIVPVLTNCAAPPLPTPRRSWELGALVRRVIDTRPAGERIALLGSGGISHWVGTPETGRINPDFDHQVLDWIRRGEGERLARLTHEEIEAQAGNGGQELRNWIAVLAALPGVTGEVLAYEPVPEWITGSALVRLAV